MKTTDVTCPVGFASQTLPDFAADSLDEHVFVWAHNQLLSTAMREGGAAPIVPAAGPYVVQNQASGFFSGAWKDVLAFAQEMNLRLIFMTRAEHPDDMPHAFCFLGPGLVHDRSVASGFVFFGRTDRGRFSGRIRRVGQHASGNAVFAWSTLQDAADRRTLDWCEKYLLRDDPEPGSGALHVMVQSERGPQMVRASTSTGQPLERGNYDDGTLSGYDALVRDLRAVSPSGRIAILDGKPGTGKTWMLRGLIYECPRAFFVHCAAEMVQQLDSPSFLPMLIEHREETGSRFGDIQTQTAPVVLLIEDGDECIVTRGPDNRSSLRALLNYGDGLLGAAFDIRCVVTTNSGHTRKDEEIDEAVLRPGRLSQRLTIGALHPAHASAILARLTKLPVTECHALLGAPEPASAPRERGFGVERRSAQATLAGVYQLARQHGWEGGDITGVPLDEDDDQ